MTRIPDHPIVARLLRDGEPQADCRCRCGSTAVLWNAEMGACCLDCVLSLWDDMDDRQRVCLLGFEEL